MFNSHALKRALLASLCLAPLTACSPESLNGITRLLSEASLKQNGNSQSGRSQSPQRLAGETALEGTSLTGDGSVRTAGDGSVRTAGDGSVRPPSSGEAPGPHVDSEPERPGDATYAGSLNPPSDKPVLLNPPSDRPVMVDPTPEKPAQVDPPPEQPVTTAPLPEKASACPRAIVRIRFGQFSYNPAGPITRWQGSLMIEQGLIGLLRKIQLEDNDQVMREGSSISWNTVTQSHYDGLVAVILAKPGTDPTLRLTLPGGTKRIPFSSLSYKGSIKVGDAGNQLQITAYHLPESSECGTDQIQELPGMEFPGENEPVNEAAEPSTAPQPVETAAQPVEPTPGL